MDNKLNYNIKFDTNAGKITAGVDRLDKAIHGVGDQAQKMGKRFSGALDKVNDKLGTVQMDSLINNLQSVSEGLDALAQPGLQFNTSMAELNAITDVSAEKLQKINKFAREQAETFGGKASAAADSYKLILSKLSPELANKPEALKAMGKSVQVLSKTMGGDTVGAAQALTTAMNQYGVSLDNPMEASEKMAEMMNIMAAAADVGSAEMPQQKAALEQVGMAAKVAGVSFAETSAAIQVLDKAGRQGSEGGVALRNVLSDLGKGRFMPDDVEASLEDAGVDISVLSDKSLTLADRLRPLRKIMDDTALITKMFGEENKIAALALIQGIETQEAYTKAVQGTNSAYEQAAVVMDSQAEKNARLKASIDNFKISMFQASGGALGYASVLGQVAFNVGNLLPLFSGTTQAIGWMTKAKNRQVIIDKISIGLRWAETTAMKAAAFATKVWTAATNRQLIASKAKAIWSGIATAATWVWTTAQWALNAALTANPIGLIIPAIAALVAGIAWVVSSTTGWGKAWDHVVTGAKYLWQAFTAGAKAHFNTFVNAFMIGVNGIKIAWLKVQMFLGQVEEEEGKRRLKKINQNTKARIESIKEGYKKQAEYALKAKNEFAKAAGSIKMKEEATKKAKEAGTSAGEGFAKGYNKAVDKNLKVPSFNAGLNPQPKGAGYKNAYFPFASFAGIKTPKVPGADPDGDDEKTNDTNKQTQTNTAIATGGTKHNYVTITFKDLIGILNIKGSDFKDSAKQMQEQTSDALLRTLAMAATAGS